MRDREIKRDKTHRVHTHRYVAKKSAAKRQRFPKESVDSRSCAEGYGYITKR